MTKAIDLTVMESSQPDFDAIGNLVSDSQNDNSVIDWNVYGKVKSVDFANKADLWFGDKNY